MPRNSEDTHENILKSFASDEEDDVQLLDDESDGIDFADDADEDDDEVEDDDTPLQNEEDDESSTEPVEEEEDDDGFDETGEPKAKTDPYEDLEQAIRFKTDRQGNFLDKNGKIIIAKGKQRDLFVRLKKGYFSQKNEKAALLQRHQEVISTSQELVKRYKELKEQVNYAQTRGLNNEEAQQAVDLMAHAKVDPKSAIRKILTVLHVNGTDLSDLGVTGPLDPQEVAKATLEAQQALAAKQVKSPEEEAREEGISFLRRHPTAQNYVGMIAEAKRRYPHMSLDEIWYQLSVHKAKAEWEKAKKPATDPVEKKRRPLMPNPQHKSRNGVVKGKLSMKAVDPTQSFDQIGRDLLRDLNALQKG